MDIKINHSHIILKKSYVKDLPDFVVITGENGSGKTQLLNYLVEGDTYGIEELNEVGDFVYKAGCELIVDGMRETNISLVGVNQHQINLGEPINEQVLVDRWGNMPHKYLSYLNLLRTTNGSQITTDTLNKQFTKDIKWQPRYSNDKPPSYISQQDLNLLKLIHEKRNGSELPITLDECIVNLPLSTNNLFSANLTLLYVQYQTRIKLGLPAEEAPWEIFNKVIEVANFKYRLKEPDFTSEKLDSRIFLTDIESGNVVNIDNLSSGEKTIMSLLLALYNSKTNAQFPEVILFDEPDASLHPSMTQHMLNVLQNVFVNDKNVKVIITTHSPTTVALSPEISIYQMDRNNGTLVKANKGDAIKSLTKGLTTLSVFYEHKKQIFVEATFDQYFYENIYNLLKEVWLSNDVYFQFIPVTSGGKSNNGADQGGGCTQVKSIVSSLRQGGNKTVYGIIDYDNINHGNDGIFILGNKIRYSIENYLFDPVLLAIFLLHENFPEAYNIGFNNDDNIRTLHSIQDSKMQSVVDNIVQLICNKNSLVVAEGKGVDYQLINGKIFRLPKLYYEINGHELEKYVVTAFPRIKQYGKDSLSIKRSIVAKAVRLFPEYLSRDLLETFLKLQDAPIS